MPTAPFSQNLVERLARARSIAVLTGAGISAESGVPTFREADGLWKKFRPEDLANVHAFLRNPELVQGWYHYRATLVRQVVPNPGHHALVALEDLVDDFTLVTQNVDNLHQRAGSQNVVELHGNITRNHCIDCSSPATAEALAALASESRAVCSSCGGLIRPDVVWFGEMLPTEAIDRAHDSAHRADVFLSIGTSAVVYPAAMIPILARDAGAYVAEINIEPSAIARDIDEVVLGPSGEVLPLLLDALRALKNPQASS